MPDRTRIPARRVGIVPILALILAVGAVLTGRTPGVDAPGGGDGLEPSGSAAAEVERVVDGDTLEVRLGSGEVEDVRMIGVDTPETVAPGEPVDCFGPEASAFTKRVLRPGEPLSLRFDAELRDDYDRLLAYVFAGARGSGSDPADGRLINAELLRRGLAETLAIEPNTAMAAEFDALARRAAARGAGLWGSC